MNFACISGSEGDVILVRPLIEFRFAALHGGQSIMVESGDFVLAERGCEHYI